jgi:mannose-6-phosphate isomerase-like protein (cupin superfamily)
MKILQALVVLVVAALSFAAGSLAERNRAEPAPLESRVIRLADARKSQGDWGSIEIYTADGTPTVGNRSILTAALEFHPGKQLQPPHQHADEEFQYVVSGTGLWHLNGKDIPLQAGDLMYAKPGDLHGIRSTGTEPLRFFVVKWISRNVEATP